MRTFVALALSAAHSAIDSQYLAFTNYLSEHGKSYATLEEFNERLALFTARDTLINEWNSRTDVTSTLGHNFLSDWTPAEINRLNTL